MVYFVKPFVSQSKNNKYKCKIFFCSLFSLDNAQFKSKKKKNPIFFSELWWVFPCKRKVQMKWRPSAETLWLVETRLSGKQCLTEQLTLVNYIKPSIIECHTKLSPHFTFLNSFIEWPKGKRSCLNAFISVWRLVQCLFFTRVEWSVSHELTLTLLKL